MGCSPEGALPGGGHRPRLSQGRSFRSLAMRWCSQTAVFLIALFAVVGVAHAQEGTPFLQGTYTLDAAASDDVNEAIERAIARMNVVKRPIARGRLKKTNQPYQQVVIEQTNSEVTTTMDNRKPISTPVTGTP